MDDRTGGLASLALIDDPTSDSLAHGPDASDDGGGTRNGSQSDLEERTTAMSDRLPKNIALEDFTEAVFGSVLRAIDTHQIAQNQRREKPAFIPGPIIFGFYLDAKQLGNLAIPGLQSRSLEDADLSEPGTPQA